MGRSPNISARTAAKILQLHHISPDEVREAVECIEGLEYAWHYHEDRGWRAMVSAEIRSRTALVVLYDAYDPIGDVYNLGSVYFK